MFLYAKVFQDIVMMNDKSLHSGLDIFTGVILGPLVEEWIRIHGMKDMEQEFGAKIRLVSNPSLAVGVFTLLNAPDGD